MVEAVHFHCGGVVLVSSFLVGVLLVMEASYYWGLLRPSPPSIFLFGDFCLCFFDALFFGLMGFFATPCLGVFLYYLSSGMIGIGWSVGTILWVLTLVDIFHIFCFWHIHLYWSIFNWWTWVALVYLCCFIGLEFLTYYYIHSMFFNNGCCLDFNNYQHVLYIYGLFWHILYALCTIFLFNKKKLFFSFLKNSHI